MKQSLTAGIVLARALVVSSLCLLTGCLDIKCGYEVLNEIVSPDNKYIATVIKQDCGATTSYSQAVVIREKSSEFDGDNTKDYIFTMNGLLNIGIHWNNSRHLVIEPPDENAIYLRRESWRDIAVSYKPKYDDGHTSVR